MSKRYIYKPNRPMDDSYVVAEFVKIMPLLEQAHKCPVRLVKIKGIIERYAVYELMQTNYNQSKIKIDARDARTALDKIKALEQKE